MLHSVQGVVVRPLVLLQELRRPAPGPEVLLRMPHPVRLVLPLLQQPLLQHSGVPVAVVHGG